MRERLRSLLPDERIEVLENTRFHPGETENDPEFARELAEGCDLYVNDAFGSAHRAHASTEAVARLLPAYAGLLLEQELEMLGRLLQDVERPYVAVVGGLKVEDKLGVLENLAEYVDTMLIGGKMAEQLRVENPLEAPVELPVDVVAAAEFAEDAESRGRRRGTRSRTAGSASTSGRRRASEFARQDPRREDRVLERADGRLRVGAVRGRDEGGRAGARRVRRLHGRRRRRLGARRQRARPRRPGHVGLDRRRRLARAARGQGAPRRRPPIPQN